MVRKNDLVLLWNLVPLQFQQQQHLDAVEETGFPEDDNVAENAISLIDIKAVLAKRRYVSKFVGKYHLE